MFRFRLRTLLLLMALLPPILAWWGWPAIRGMLWPQNHTEIVIDYVWTVRTDNLNGWWLENREPPSDQTDSLNRQ
jgi:hypothetical protein